MVHFVKTNWQFLCAEAIHLCSKARQDYSFAGLTNSTELPSPLETQWSVSRLATTSSSKLLIVPATLQTGGLVGEYCTTNSMSLDDDLGGGKQASLSWLAAS